MTRSLGSAKNLCAFTGLCLILGAAPAAHAASAFVVRYEDDGAGHRQVVGRSTVPGPRLGPDQVDESTYPQQVAEHQAVGLRRIVELKSLSLAALDKELLARGVSPEKRRRRSARDEVRTLVESGPAANRIDLVFMGDGYTGTERDKFFADIQRMVDDMFHGETFQSYLPLFNVHAVFRASNESGIGRNAGKDTAYGLYRDGNTLRAIYPGDSDAWRTSCDAAPGCDYPIIIANDPYYGGLGGEVAISTSSPTSGTVVLRHELGHNFGRVGEEYDAGGHFGANVSTSLARIGWRPWLTEAVAAGSSVPAEAEVPRLFSWPWKNLATGPYAVTFLSDGLQLGAKIRLSYSGVPNADQMAITLDGQEIPYIDAGTDDRVFKDLDFGHGFSAGTHTLKFTELTHDGNNWVSSVDIFEYGDGYHEDNAFVGAFPLFDEDLRVDGYRSTHEDCLMRDMTSHHFCKICQQNNWHEFLGKVSLIDDVVATRGAAGVEVTVKMLALDALDIKWLKAGREIVALRGKSSWSLPATEAAGDWEVQVAFATPEVRQDPSALLKDKRALRL